MKLPGLFSSRESRAGIVIGLLGAGAVSVMLLVNRQDDGSKPAVELNASAPLGSTKPTKGVSQRREVQSAFTKQGKLTVDDAQRISSSLMDAETAAELLRRAAQEIEGQQDRAFVMSSIISALCKSGNAEAAWSLIEKEEGLVRELQLGSFFLTSTESSDLLFKKLGTLGTEKERTQALHALALTRPFDFLNAGPDDIKVASKQEWTMASAGIAAHLSEMDDPVESRRILEASFAFTASHGWDLTNLLRILEKSKNVTPFEQWDIAKKPLKGLADADRERVLKLVAPEMVSSNTDDAMRKICTDPSTKYSYPVLSSAVARMYANSPAEANTWLTANLDGLDPATGQRIISCVAQEAIRSGEFSTAEQWAGRILNADVRSELLKQSADQQAKMNASKK